MPALHLKHVLAPALLLAMFAAPATGQSIREISDSIEISGALDDNSSKTALGNFYDCYYLDTQPGQVWNILVNSYSMDAAVEVWAGSCPAVKQSNDHTPVAVDRKSNV